MIWSILGILAATAGIIFFQYPYLLKTGSKRDWAAFSILLAGGAVYGILYALRVKLGSPYELMIKIDKPVTDILMKLFDKE